MSIIFNLALGEMFPNNYHGVLLFPENKTRLRDEYHRLPVGYGASISNSIRFCSGTQSEMTLDQIDAIAEKLNGSNIEQLTKCPVRCDVIIGDFATLMAQMEAASTEGEEKLEDDDTIAVTVSANVEVSPDFTEVLNRKREALRNTEWKRMGKIGACIATALITGIVAGRALSLNRK